MPLESDTANYGSGLSFGGGADASAGPGNNGADVPPAQVQPMPSPAPDQGPSQPPDGEPTRPFSSFGASLHTFGQGLNKLMNGPSYTAPDPQATALDQTADTLQQRIQRANSVATNPILGLFNPEGVKAARDFIPQATEQLQKIKTQKADMQANRQQAESLGLAPGETADEASQQDRVEAAVNGALKGDLKKFKGLQSVDPKRAEAIQDQVHEAVAGHLTKAQLAFDSLAGMQNQGQYAAKLDQLRKDGTLTDLEALGLKVPASYDQFGAAKGREGQALREARIGVDTIRQKLEERNTYQPMEEKEAKTYNGRITTAYGDQVTNGTWGRNGASGTRGLIVNGASDPRDLGKSFTLGTDDQRKAVRDEYEAQVTKQETEKNRSFSRTYQLATTDGKGSKVKDGTINTNPNVQQGIAEGLASMLRGGGGGATSGLLKIEGSKRAYVQTLLDTITANYAGGINALKDGADPEKVKPYLTKLTQGQQRDVLDALKAYNDNIVGSRVGRTAERAGALGFDSSVFGYGKGENAEIDDATERGRQAQIARMMPNHQAIGGGDGVLQLGAQRAGAGATALPPGTTPTNQQPGGDRVATPVQQAAAPAGQPSPPVGPNGPQTPAPPPSPPGAGAPPAGPSATVPPGTSPAGGGSPMTIAGQQVAVPLPPGASPNFVPALQRIESGNEKSPWTAGAKGSSASGAFQFIKDTWAANKPAGAPDRAGDATPAQQAQALATLTTKNAASLKGAGVPVNDTNLYIAHNVGTGGATALLHASPNADARTVVGEAAAKNNPLFFKGRPTVATVLQRYQNEMAGGQAGGNVADVARHRANAEPKSVTVGPPPQDQGLWSKIGDLLSTKGTNPETGLTPEGDKALGDTVVEHAPAIGSTVGAVVGTAGGPLGTVGGGAAGGAAGQSFKDYMQGRPQDPKAIVKQAALGGVLGIAPESRPLLGAAARVLGVGGVDAGVTAAEGGDAGDVAASAIEGGAYALGGEALGRFVSSGGAQAFKALSRYTTGAQAELSANAGKLAEARATLASELPKLPGVGGEAGAANPKYDAAKKTADDATQAIKDHGQNPDDMVHAYEQAKAGTSRGEAAVMRPAQAEKTNVSQGYDDLRGSVRDTGVGAPKANQPVPDGPASMIRTADNPTGKVPEQFRPEAEHAEMLIKAPAKDFGDKWTQLQNAGTELVKKRMDFLQAGDKTSAAAMDNLFQGVRNQQKAVAEYVFGKEGGAKVVSQLENLDTRYAKVMSATGGMSYEKMQSVLASGNTPARRELEKNFAEFAKGDPSAIRAFNAMKAGARGDWKSEAALMGPVIAGEVAANLHGVPTVGAITALVGGHRLYKLAQGYMNAKLLNRAVTFKDFLAQEVKTGLAQFTGTAAQRGAAMQ